MKLKSVYLQKGRERALERKHPWIFSGGIQKEERPEEGDLVQILDFKGNFLALGHYQSPKASIRIKILSFKEEAIDQNWWNQKFQNAWNVRTDLNIQSDSTNAFRWVFGEGDWLPGLIVDWYDGHAVVQCYTLGMYNSREFIFNAIKEVAGSSLKTIYDKSGESMHSPEIESTFAFGETESAVILENGVKFNVNWVEGQKTGFFLDQRDNRELVAKYCNGKKILNAFAYSGGFSIYALQQGAMEVHSVDLSEKACALADENAKLNQVDQQHKSVVSDVQEYLKGMDDSYDVVILDPPAFAKRRKAVHNAIQAYKRLNASAIKKMKPGTLLFTFSCSQNVTPQIFTDTIRAAAIETGRPIQILKELRQPADHPENIYFPEGHYLKGLMLRVM